MSGISTHVLDLTRGKPASGLKVRLQCEQPNGIRMLAERETDGEGRVTDLLPGDRMKEGFYQLRFETGRYFQMQGNEAFHPFVEIAFDIRNISEHYHVPLLITPHSYSTYRGS